MRRTFEWTVAYAKQVRKQLDDLGVRCHSTHNGEESFTPEGIKKAVELNHILGAKYIVMAGSSPISGLAGWKALGERITGLMEKLAPLGMSSGFHNHETEWELVEGKRPMDVLAATTPKEFMLQFDVGSCVAAKQDPVAWIKSNPGRIKSIHCKDWAHWPWGGYRVLFGEGSSPWQKIFDAAESVARHRVLSDRAGRESFHSARYGAALSGDVETDAKLSGRIAVERPKCFDCLPNRCWVIPAVLENRLKTAARTLCDWPPHRRLCRQVPLPSQAARLLSAAGAPPVCHAAAAAPPRRCALMALVRRLQ